MPFQGLIMSLYLYIIKLTTPRKVSFLQAKRTIPAEYISFILLILCYYVSSEYAALIEALPFQRILFLVFL